MRKHYNFEGHNLSKSALQNINSIVEKRKKRLKRDERNINFMDISFQTSPPANDCPAKREEGTESLVSTYASMTPGQKSVKEHIDYTKWVNLRQKIKSQMYKYQ